MCHFSVVSVFQSLRWAIAILNVFDNSHWFKNLTVYVVLCVVRRTKSMDFLPKVRSMVVIDRSRKMTEFWYFWDGYRRWSGLHVTWIDSYLPVLHFDIELKTLNLWPDEKASVFNPFGQSHIRFLCLQKSLAGYIFGSHRRKAAFIMCSQTLLWW